VGAFVSQLEQLMPAKELKFKPTPGFGSAYKKYLRHAIAHPAKMNTRLTEFLIEQFTQEGDVVLDPMAGSGQTGVVAAVHGRDAVCVDLEQKFFKWMEKARRKVERQQTLAVKGKIKNVCGDARQLSTLLTEADAVVTSPPYSKTDPTTFTNRHIGNREEPRSEYVKGEGYSDDPSNIGNLRHGEIDAVITSPPYSDALTGGGQVDKEGFHNPFKGGYNKNSKANIGNLRHGKVDTIITSPPYEGQLAFFDTDFMIKTAKERSDHYKDGTSKGHFASAEAIKRGNEKLVSEYSHNPSNIGNLHKETYLEAMLQVYREMHKVLKPHGKAIIVIKPFIRNKKVVDLPYHTYLLLKQAGFKLTNLFKLRLQNMSFWRILYHKKFVNVPQIKHEYVLVTMKSAVLEA